MLGAIIGDIVGSVYEWSPVKTIEFDLFSPRSRFTDDTVLTVAVADAILHQKDYARTIWAYGRKYPHAGYGGSFANWLKSNDLQPYGSFGNGSAMRVSPVGFAFDTEDEVLTEALRTAQVTHNHPEGIKGAQATALAIWIARQGKSKAEIKEKLERRFAYDLSRTLDDIRPAYSFDVSCQGSVPESIIAFLESNNYEDAVRKAISLGGDSDTMACIAGGIAQAFYKEIPEPMVNQAWLLLDDDLKKIVEQFKQRYLA
ncbi:putative hydrolase [hydrocarbon metagenome]|uniref:Putative hydrolase n=1 Tax=hydrocarbon metagenome TaxID=938273 RepID=A0A0W8E615_9ZZZZ